MLRLGIRLNRIKTVGRSFNPADIPFVTHWYSAESNITFGSTAIRAVRVPDLVGTHDFIDSDNTKGFTYIPSDVDINNYPALEYAFNTVFTVDRAAGDAATGWNMSLPISITMLAKLGYSSNLGELFRDDRGFNNGVQVVRNSSNPTSSSNNKLSGASTNNLNLNGAGVLSVNYNSTTGAVLTIGETTPYQILTFEFGTDAQRFYRNGNLIVTSGVPGTPRTFNGGQVRFGAGGESIRFVDLIVANTNMTTPKFDALKSYYNSRYNTSF